METLLLVKKKKEKKSDFIKLLLLSVGKTFKHVAITSMISSRVICLQHLLQYDITDWGESND